MAIYPSVKFCVSPRSVPLCFIMCDRVRENRPQVGKIDIGLGGSNGRLWRSCVLLLIVCSRDPRVYPASIKLSKPSLWV